MPAEEVPSSEGGQQYPYAAEQRNQRKDAPEDSVRRGLILD
jgi:hypothetical protein